MRWLVVAAAVVISAPAYARGGGGHGGGHGGGSSRSSHAVRGYTTHAGTHVAPHRQTNPNRTQYDNYGTRGNVNPYTGAVGTRTPRF